MSHRSSSRRLCLAGLAFICACVVSGAASAACVLRVGWDEWSPYITYKDGRFQGVEYELLESTADAAGCALDMKQIPWARALKMLGAGGLDLLYGAGYSAERAEFAKFSIPYRVEQFALVTRAKAGDDAMSISLNDWLQSPGDGNMRRALGVFRGDYYGKQIDQILESNKNNVMLVELSQNEQMTEMLEIGRLDGYIVEDVVAQMQIQAATFPMQHFLIEEQVGDPLHYMFSLSISDDVIERFNMVIQKRQSESR